MTQLDDLNDYEATSRALKVSERTVRRLQETGELASVRLRGRVLFRRQDIEALIERSTVRNQAA